MASELRIPNREGDRVAVFCEAVFLVNTRDSAGRPKLLTRIHDDETIDLAGGEEFVTGWIFDRDEDT